MVLVGAAFLAASPLLAQQTPSSAPELKRESFRLSEEKVVVAQTKPPAEKPKPTENKGPTEITATSEASFDEKAHKAVFIGNVRVKDPQFTLTSDKLTAFLKNQDAKAAVTPTPAASPASSPANGNTASSREGAGGLERAIAEGNVVIIQDKLDDNGKPIHYVGKAAKAEYNATTGDVVLSGWPQVQQGINNHISTEESTVMTLNRNGRMKTSGGSRTLIQDQGSAK
jgi:lipopolysaccharide export system protein LptA